MNAGDAACVPSTAGAVPSLRAYTELASEPSGLLVFPSRTRCSVRLTSSAVAESLGATSCDIASMACFSGVFAFDSVGADVT